jgi:hypothetical protein
MKIRYFILIGLIFLLLIGIIAYPNWKEDKIEKAENYCNSNICQIGNSTDYTSSVYASKFNSCFCLKDIYTEKAIKLYWLLF